MLIKTIIPLALVGNEMIIANSALRASLAIYHLISNARSWNNCKQHVHKNEFSWGVTHINDEVEGVRQKENDQCKKKYDSVIPNN